MLTIRRLYIFLVCVVSLQAVAWATIALLQDLLISGGQSSITFIAFQIAVIIIGLPFFLVHWLWAQHLAGRDLDERASALRRLYLYGTLAAFLAPLVAVAFNTLAILLQLAFGGRPDNGVSLGQYSTADTLLRDLVALGSLGLLWFYHWRITAADATAAPESGSAAAIRRLYVLSFSAAGIGLVTVGVISTLRWIMYYVGGGDIIGVRDISNLTDELTRLILGTVLWFSFWRWAQALFTGAGEEERASALRKFYLYVIVFIAVLGVVSNAAFVLAGLFRSFLGLSPTGDIREPLSIIIGLGMLWAYHSYVLRGDSALAGEAPRQAGVRRLYLYLVAAIGFAALLVGLSGNVNVLIRAITESFAGDDLREQLAWCTAALIAGLPVWALPWRTAQSPASSAGAVGADERRSGVRKAYLYFYLFVATLTVLSTAVYIVYRLLSLALGAQITGNLVSEVERAIAFILIAVGVWLYHGWALRSDGQLNRREQSRQLASLRVAVVDDGEGRFGRAVLDGLRRELPGLTLDSIGLTPSAAETMGGTQDNIAELLANAGLIVGPWNITVSSSVGGAVVASPARKLLAPIRVGGWDWAGVDRWNDVAMAGQAVLAVKQIAAGEEVKPVRLGAGAILGIVIAVLVLMILFAIPVLFFFIQ